MITLTQDSIGREHILRDGRKVECTGHIETLNRYKFSDGYWRLADGRIPDSFGSMPQDIVSAVTDEPTPEGCE